MSHGDTRVSAIYRANEGSVVVHNRPQEPTWITLTNANPYRKQLRVRLRSDMIAGYEENADMEYNNHCVPQGTLQRTFVYTLGGNQFMVGETLAEIDALMVFTE